MRKNLVLGFLLKWNPWQRTKPPMTSEAEFARAETFLNAWKAFGQSPGWSLLQEEILAELRSVIGTMASQTLGHPEYARLAGRVDALLWLGTLPESRIAHYTDLAAASRPQVVAPERDGPVQWDDV